MELTRPFWSEQLFSGAVTDILRNTDSTGKQVYNPQADGTQIAEAITAHLYRAFEPGTFRSLGRVWNAAAGNVSDSGRSFELGNELLSMTIGQRVSSVNVKQAMGFRSAAFMRDLRDARSLFTREFLSRGTRSDSDIFNSYLDANAANQRLVGDLYLDFKAASLLIPRSQLAATMRASGIGKETVRMVETGIYRPFDASAEAEKVAPKERVEAYKEARSTVSHEPL
jgi:hypothetical protein